MKDTFTTVLIVESKHHPTNSELRSAADAFMKEGKRQGFEPLQIRSTFEVIAEDRSTIEKWFKRNEPF